MSKFWLCKTFLFSPYQERHCCFLTITRRDSAWLESHSQFLNRHENIHLLSFSGSYKPSLSHGQGLNCSALDVRDGNRVPGQEDHTSRSVENQPSINSTRNLLLNTARVQTKYSMLNQSKNFNGIQSWLSAGIFTSNYSTCWKAADCFSAGNNYDYRQQHYYIYLMYKHTHTHTRIDA